jgi:hypothetical protein
MSAFMGLNIGGQVYHTTRSTLTRFTDSILARMLPNMIQYGSVAKDPQGNFFFDRDGVVFRHILNFLRTGKLSLPENFEEFQLLIEEAQFYGLSELVEAVRTKSKEVANTKASIMAEQRPNDIDYVKLMEERRHGIAHGQVQLVGMGKVLESIFQHEIKNELANITRQTTTYYGDADIGHESCIQFDQIEPLPWSGCVKILTMNGFTCKSTSVNKFYEGQLESEFWLFERKNG